MTIAVNGRFARGRMDGVHRVARQLVPELARRAEVRLYVPAGDDPPDGLPPGARVVRGVLRDRVWEHLELPLRALRDRPTLSLDPANAGPWWGGRRVLVLHDVFPLTCPDWYSPRFRRWFRATVVRAARNATRVVMFSRWAKREAARVLGIPAERIAVITQGIAPFDGPPSPCEVRATLDRLGLGPGYILATGAGDRRKNGAFLEAVRERLRARGITVELVSVGEPHDHIHAPEPVRPGPTAARRLGHVSDEELRALYAGAGVFCFPSLAEGFGRPPLEAMACGVPVLAAPYGCAREVLGDAARVLPLRPEAWADTIARLLGDGEARRRQVVAGRDHAARYTWAAAADQLVEAVGLVARDHGGPVAVSALAAGGR